MLCANQCVSNPSCDTLLATHRASYPDQEPLEVAPPGSLPMMETIAGPAGVATAGDGVGRLTKMEMAAAASYLGLGGGSRGVARRVTEDGDNDDEDGGFK